MAASAAARYPGSMCGRLRLASDVSEIKLHLRLPPQDDTPNFPARWNIAPTAMLPIVRLDGDRGQRRLDLMRWGLVPFWAKDEKIGHSMFNARAEGIATKPAFREALKRRRCLVPADGKRR